MGFLHRGVWVVATLVLVLSTSMVVRSMVNANDAGSAQAKQAAVWGKIMSTSGSSGPWPSTLQLIKLFIESMDPTMHTFEDEIPNGRQKLIHSVGGTAKFHFQWNAGIKYTGLFKSANYGIVRVSGAKSWDSTKDPVTGNFTPGMGVKLFRTNLPSGNFVAMNKLNSQDSWNPFKYTWSNHVSHQNLDLSLKAVALKFESVSAWPSHVGTSNLASFTEGGQSVASPVFPWQLLFSPTSDLKTKWPDTFTTDLPTQLGQIPSGTVLFTVYALDTPNEQEKPVVIGRMITDSAFVKSSYADTTLFFRHQTFEEDIALSPQWAQYCDDMNACNVCPTDYNCFAN